MAEPGAELARDVVSCPGADTCNLAVTQSRGLAADIGDALEKAGLAEVGGVRINISGCTNSCGQHHIADIGFLGLERRAHGRAAPGYQMELGGHVSNMEIEFGKKATKLPAKRASEAVVRVVEQFAGERDAGETFRQWLERSGGAGAVGKTLVDLDEFPTPDEAPDYYIDFDETGPYVAEIGDSGVRDVTACDRDLDDTSATARRPGPRRARRVSAELEQRAGVVGDQVGVGDASATARCSRRRSRTACSSTSPRRSCPRSRSCSSTRSTTSRRRSGTSSRCASATT